MAFNLSALDTFVTDLISDWLKNPARTTMAKSAALIAYAILRSSQDDSSYKEKLLQIANDNLEQSKKSNELYLLASGIKQPIAIDPLKKLDPIPNPSL